jgi:hydrogenase expression/formation protein HypC
MCLALPGKILSISNEETLPMAEVDFSGVKKPVCIAYTPEAKIGDFVIVHVGFSITLLNEEKAQQTLGLLS